VKNYYYDDYFEMGSQYAAQAGFELETHPLASAFPVLGLQMCTTMPGDF
jgi:hypothetical protein